MADKPIVASILVLTLFSTSVASAAESYPEVVDRHEVEINRLSQELERLSKELKGLSTSGGGTVSSDIGETLEDSFFVLPAMMDGKSARGCTIEQAELELASGNEALVGIREIPSMGRKRIPFSISVLTNCGGTYTVVTCRLSGTLSLASTNVFIPVVSYVGPGTCQVAMNEK